MKTKRNKNKDIVVNNNKIPQPLIEDSRAIIINSRSQAIRSVDYSRVQMYWNLGRRIFEEEQDGKERAEYGTYLIKNLAAALEPEFGSGFSVRQLERSRQFYRLYPIASTLRTQLNWSQYKMLITIADDCKREYYELESIHNAWTGRELERQINAQLYERLLLSNDKETLLSIARKEHLPDQPQEIIKDPMVLEFLGLERKPQYYEKDLEISLIEHLQQFLLEMGNGFSFVARQKRILIEDDEYFIDLVLYNRLLRCFVIVELKTSKLTHQDLGQLQMYVNYYDRKEKLSEENPTIGLILCTAKNGTMVKMSLPENNRTIMASQYELYFPSDKLQAEVKQLAEAMRINEKKKKQN